FLDLGVVVPGTTTGVDVLNIVANNGICASLDAAGAPVTVKECSANAGTLKATADSATLANGKAVVEALPNGGINVPLGYSSLFVLTSGTGLVIEQVAASPKFTVGAPGLYTIHTLVYDADPKSPNFLDLGVVVPGTTTGVDVLNIVANNGICASLDAAGAPVTVYEDKCTAFSGGLYSMNPISCLYNGKTIISAKTNANPVVPINYKQLFVLTEAFSLKILAVSDVAEFEVGNAGFYRIHSLVYNPMTLDLSVVVPGQTTGFDVVNIIKKNNICASLDVYGAPNLVIGSKWFCYFFNRYSKNQNMAYKGSNSKYNNDGALNGILNKYDSYEAFKTDFINSNSQSNLFPNPVSNALSINMEVFDDEVVNYSIIDLSGRTVLRGLAKDLSLGTQKINANTLNSGMYLVKLESKYRSITKKIIVKK
ncbi:MAG: T9SS type A sorting domain-containing protein, partial [Confluentibacter sp.]|nr:T9SS type A sorting domain-containing protein [Confluentibacter sp.]